MRRVDPDYIELPDAYQTAALRGSLTRKCRDHIDTKMVEKEYGKDELLNEVRRYAAVKRDEKRNPNAMEIDAVSTTRASRQTGISKGGQTKAGSTPSSEPAAPWQAYSHPVEASWIGSCEHADEGWGIVGRPMLGTI